MVSREVRLLVLAHLPTHVRARAHTRTYGQVKGVSRVVHVSRALKTLLGFTITMWTLYPVIWLAGSEGFGKLSVEAEVLHPSVLAGLCSLALLTCGGR